ncbi:MAG TPA: von Willebrand factor type A domain-containing protein [Pirellulales bacterium]|jgi:hypothetical protein|nr:von Willebrand factor type A domain-containing protein [Pirellulales bacterium]
MAAEFGSDPWLDARLRDVPLPPGMLARLEQISSTSDDELDAIVSSMPVPRDLTARLSRIPRVRRSRLPWRELSLAAAVLITVSVSLLRVPVQLPERSTGDGSRFLHRGAGGVAHRGAAGQAGKPAADASDSTELAAGERVAPRSVPLPYDDPRSADRSASNYRNASSEADEAAANLTMHDHSPPLDDEGDADFVDDAAPSAMPGRDGILTAPRGSDRLPPLETVSRTPNRGLAPPLLPGYDLLYQLKTGERPFVSPEVAPALASSPVPLVRDTSSYLLARESVASGRLPPADEVRIEDFLAAFDDLFPAAGAPFVLHMSAGPSPFGEPGMQLLQVGLSTGGSLGPDPATGAPRVVARGATLTVTFNPQVVQAYRLVGHATTTLTGPVAPVTKIDLTAGSEVAGLFELWLKPTGGDDVATAELVWNDPAGGAPRRMSKRFSRSQLAKSFADSAASLQAVALAAETARALRSHATPGRGLGRVLDLASQVQPGLRSQQSFGQLVQFVAQAEKVRANPGAGARRAAADSQP